MYKRKDFRITQKQLEYVLGKEWEFFKTKILTNCFCHKCGLPGNSTIINYEIFVNYLHDTIFRGYCKKCGGPLARYTETGENEEIRKRIASIV